MLRGMMMMVIRNGINNNNIVNVNINYDDQGRVSSIPSLRLLQLLLLLLISLPSKSYGMVLLPSSSSSTSMKYNFSCYPRQVCLFQDYTQIRGPYFRALFDQLLEEQLFSLDQQQGQQQEHEQGRQDDEQQSETAICRKGQRSLYNVALCTTASQAVRVKEELQPLLEEDLVSLHVSRTTINEDDGDTDGSSIETSMSKVGATIVILDDYDPMTLEEHLNELNPSVLWITDGNAFEIRYRLRTSGLDRYIEEQCTGILPSKHDDDDDDDGYDDDMFRDCNRLYVGEGAGAIIAGQTMSLAHVRGDNPTVVPEPQFFGLNLLPPSSMIVVGVDNDNLKKKKEKEEIIQQHDKTKEEYLNALDVSYVQNDQVWIWSQVPKMTTTIRAPKTTKEENDDKTISSASNTKSSTPSSLSSSATTFIFSPNRRGTIENWKLSSPLPPLALATTTTTTTSSSSWTSSSSADDYHEDEGVRCRGEPAVDPSRSMQQIGDSEWIDEIKFGI